MRRAITLVVIVVIAAAIYFAYANNWLEAPVAGGTGGSGGTGGTGGTTEVVASGIPRDATQAVVEYVHDGDTLFLEDGRKVRLLGVNTPEIGDNLECYGDEATTLLRSLLPEGSEVWVAEDVEPLDQYGRSLLFVYTPEGVNVNLALLSAGAATVEMYSPNLRLQDEIEAAEDAARDAGVGLWRACR